MNLIVKIHVEEDKNNPGNVIVLVKRRNTYLKRIIPAIEIDQNPNYDVVGSYIRQTVSELLSKVIPDGWEPGQRVIRRKKKKKSEPILYVNGMYTNTTSTALDIQIPNTFGAYPGKFIVSKEGLDLDEIVKKKG